MTADYHYEGAEKLRQQLRRDARRDVIWMVSGWLAMIGLGLLIGWPAA